MNADNDNSARMRQAAEDEEALSERASAPTLRDLSAAPKGQFTTIVAGPDPAPPDGSGVRSPYDSTDDDK